MEIWKDINGYEGYYQVSNIGNVRSIERTLIRKTSRYGHPVSFLWSAKAIIATDNGHGYKIVSLNKDGKRKNHYVHRLVADAFIDNPNGYKEVNHKDYDKENNSVENLEWSTRVQNVRWSHERMRHACENARRTNLGLRYISMRKGRYRVNIRIERLGYKFDRSFPTLEEAISAKENFIRDKEYFANGQAMLPVR